MISVRDYYFIREKLGTIKLYRHNLLKILWAIQDEYRYIPHHLIRYLCSQTNMNPEEIHSVVSFYHFFSLEHRGDITIYLDTSVTAHMAGYKDIKKTFEKALGIKVGEVTSDMQFGLFETSCMGLAEQGPAALVNHQAVTHLTPDKVYQLVADLKLGKMPEEIPEDHLHRTGPVFFQPLNLQKTIGKLVSMNRDEVIEEVNKSGLLGRGGAGFPVGKKWGFCRGYEGPRYIFANADEGEPGTFKDRALLHQSPEQLITGLIIAGYAIDALCGFIYLRAEYFYLLEKLEATINNFRAKGLLGEQILGSDFSFEIEIKFGAGAYVCGEASALLESSEGKRGEPRNKPPRTVEKGYLGRPTVINNVESLCSISSILNNGGDWYAAMGTERSKGSKLLSIAGDCARPGIYEVELGISIEEILRMAKAEDTQAVQVGGPSGELVIKNEFDRIIGFEDLTTGGAITVFDSTRDLLEVIKVYSNFFMEESCGFCVPCRAGTVLINETLDKILKGKGVARDIKQLKTTCSVIAHSSRCGLGKTAANPIMDSINKLSNYYDNIINNDMEFVSDFDLQESLRKAKEGIV